MATIRKRGDSWQAQIRIKGYAPQSKTFPLKVQAEAWAKKEETRINRAEAGIASGQPSVRDIIEKYRDEVSINRKGEAWEANKIKALLKEKWIDVPCDKLDPQQIRDWIKTRQKTVQDSTARRELSLLAGIFKAAIKDGWIKIPISPTKLVAWPDKCYTNTRTITQADLARIVGPVPTHPTVTLKDYLPYAAWFAFETALRIGEVAQLTWDDIDTENLTVKVIDEWTPGNKQGKSVKNGESRDVPLTPRAIQLINTLSSFNEDVPFGFRVFGMSKTTMDQYWRKAVTDAGLAVGDVVFHDLRRSGLTRMAKVFDVKELAKVSGHLDIKTLIKVYYQPSAKELAEKLRQLPQDTSPVAAA